MARKSNRRVYTATERQVALSFLEAYRGDVDRAAKRAGVPPEALRFWDRQALEGDDGDPGAIPPLDVPGELKTDRPLPPKALLDEDRYPVQTVPAPELADWAFRTFITPGGLLYNEAYEHLEAAHIGFLWTNLAYVRGGMQVAGQAEMPGSAKGNKWAVARAEQQWAAWFGEIPDFVVTFDAPLWAEADDATVCARTEHELLHCGCRRIDGTPVVSDEGEYSYRLDGHEVEEFVAVGERYGVEASAGKSRALYEAWKRGPTVARARIKAACGTCGPSSRR